jgi:hypothetical protein
LNNVASGLFLVVLLLLAATVVAAMRVLTRGTVGRDRLEAFARRQQLTITVDNGGQVIRYLATTRRWRVAGLFAGIVLSQLVAPPGSIVHIDSIVLFMGWFLGALVAEVRVAHLEHARVRAASLQPRQAGRYVGPVAWALVPAAAVIVALTGAAIGVADVLGRAEPDWWRIGPLSGTALVVAGAIRWIQQRVLGRAQPLAAPDVLAADNAMRSRSLHVLCGGGAAMVLFLWLFQFDALGSNGTTPMSVGIARVLSSFVVALGGWVVATSTWPPRTAARTPA